MKLSFHRSLYATILCLLLSPAVAAEARAEGQRQALDIRYLHVMLGRLDADKAWTITDDSGDTRSADRSDLIYGGVAAQLARGSGAVEYGIESGGMISFKNDTNLFARSDSGDTTALIEVKNQLWLIDLSLGGFVSVRPWRSVRLYAAAGPSVMIGSLAIDDDDVEVRTTGNGEPVEFRPSSRETDVDVGVYGRAGFDIILDNGLIFGVSARRVNSELDFGDSGVIDLDDTQYFLTMGRAF